MNDFNWIILICGQKSIEIEIFRNEILMPRDRAVYYNVISLKIKSRGILICGTRYGKIYKIILIKKLCTLYTIRVIHNNNNNIIFILHNIYNT